MPSDAVNDLSKDWASDILTGEEPSVCEIATIVFGLSSYKIRLEEMVESDDHEKKLDEKTQTCLTLLMSYLLANGITTLDDLEANPLVLVSGISRYPSMGVIFHLQ